MTEPIYYAGIGSRKTPQAILIQMKVLAFILAEKGFVLRSGGADGADSAFEQGCDRINGVKEIYLPWKRFNENESPLFEPDSSIRKYASQFHPVWETLSFSVKQLHARNCQQVLGKDLQSPSAFVLCWTSPNHGGTSQAIRVAEANGIPVINMALYKGRPVSDLIFILQYWMAPRPMPLFLGPKPH